VSLLSKVSILERYIPLVKFLGEVFGDYCEIALHDLKSAENSILAIENSHVSGRSIGGSLTDLGLRLLHQGQTIDKDYIANYKGKNSLGEELRSSTYFIRDEENNVIGALCININVKKLKASKDLIQETVEGIFGLKALTNIEEEPTETIHTSIEELTTSIISEVMASAETSPERMSQEEKMAIVKELQEKGIFLIRGSVERVATYLDASEATIYRYLNKVSNNK